MPLFIPFCQELWSTIFYLKSHKAFRRIFKLKFFQSCYFLDKFTWYVLRSYMHLRFQTIGKVIFLFLLNVFNNLKLWKINIHTFHILIIIRNLPRGHIDHILWWRIHIFALLSRTVEWKHNVNKYMLFIFYLHFMTIILKTCIQNLPN